MRIKNRKPLEWFAFAPIENPPRTGPDVLSSPTSTIMRAISAGKMVIVEDIQKELKKNKDFRHFIQGSTKDHDNGSIFAYPIYCPNIKEPIYVLSIFANRSLCFLERHIDRYTWIVERFVPRILLEHHLFLMKGEQHEKE